MQEDNIDEIIEKHMLRRTLEEGNVMKTQLKTTIEFLQFSDAERKLHDKLLSKEGVKTIAAIIDASQICAAGVASQPTCTKVCIANAAAKCKMQCACANANAMC